MRGNVPLGGCISKNTRNEVDGGIQCCVRGPDKLDIGPLSLEKKMNKSLDKLPKLQQGVSGFDDLFLRTRCKYSNKERARDKKLSIYLRDKSMLSWFRPPTRIPKLNHLSLNVIVESSDGSPLSQSDAKVISSSYKNAINLGSVPSAEDSTNVIQVFYQLSKSSFNRLLKDQDELGGFSISNDSDIDTIISHYCNYGNTKLLSTDKVVKSFKPKNEGVYNGFIRVFSGVTPPLESNCLVTNELSGLKIGIQYSSAREYSQFSPLSCGFFQSNFHGHQIDDEVIKRVKQSLGGDDRGTYESRSCMKHIGSCSYLGPRKSLSVALNRPNVSEGPKERVCDRSQNRWWHRKKINHSYWPYTLSLLNIMVGPATLAAYYIYAHMSKLYEVCNSTTSWCKFCPSVIMTIDFSCSCHVDTNDREKKTTSSMINKLRLILEEMSMLKSKSVPFCTAREKEAVCSLNHLLYWGFCLPTTCCYQYIFRNQNLQKPKIRIYQWFMCPGLGTTHLIKNYWVHMMLAGLFSHCTSAPIYIVNDSTVYFGRCPYVTMSAWGAH